MCVCETEREERETGLHVCFWSLRKYQDRQADSPQLQTHVTWNTQARLFARLLGWGGGRDKNDRNIKAELNIWVWSVAGGVVRFGCFISY